MRAAAYRERCGPLLIGLWASVVALALLALPGAAHAQRVTVVTTTSAAQVAAGEDFALQVRADCEGCQIQNLELPALGEFDIVGRSVSQPMQFQMGGGATQVQVAVIHNLRLRARQAGRVRIAPAVAVVNGQRHAGNAVDIQVTPGGQGGSVAGGQMIGAAPLPVPGAPTPTGSLDGANLDGVAFLRTVVDPVDPVVGQQVTVTLLLYTRVAARNLQIEREIATDGFWVHDLIGVSAPPPRSSREVVSGVPYDVHVIRHFAAFPLEAGDLTFGAPRMTIHTGGGFLFGSRPEALVREGVPVAVRVRPLPPPATRGAVVGRYTLRTQLDRETVRTGDAVTLTAILEGEGNLRDVELALAELPGLRAHPPRREDDIRALGVRVGGTSRIEWLLVAEQPGTYTLPPLSLTVFDPYAERYETLSSQPLTLTVAGAPLVQATPDAGVGAPAEGEPPVATSATIGEIRTRSGLSRQRAPLSSHPAYWATLFGVPTLLLLGWGVMAQRARSRQRDQSADKVAAGLVRDRLDAAKRAVKSADVAAFYTSVAAALRAALEGRLGEPVGSLTHAQLGERLVRAGMGADLRKRLVEELEGCDFARFSAEAGSDTEMERCLSRVRAMVQRIERFSPGGVDAEQGEGT